MRKKIMAILLGILVATTLAGTALAGDHGPIDLATAMRTVRAK